MSSLPLLDGTLNPRVPSKRAHEHLAERLISAFNLDSRYAAAIARLFVDPTRVRRQIDMPHIKRIPDGNVVYLTGDVFSAAVSASPINPRTNEFQVYPIALRGEDSKHPPLRVRPAPDNQPFLQLFASSRAHSEHVLTKTAEFLRSYSELRDAIAQNGVMEPVTIVLAELNHDDGTPPVLVPISIDGSTRTTHCHDLLELNPVEVVYRWPQASARDWNGRLGQLGAAAEATLGVRHIFTYPARVLIQVKSENARRPINMVDASRSIISGIHIDRPEQWPDGSKRDEIADAVLDHLLDESCITPSMRDYLAGLLAPEDLRQRKEAGIEVFPLYPDERAAMIVRTIIAERNAAVVSVGYRSMIAVRSVSAKQKADIAGELMMRAFRHIKSDADRKAARASYERALILPEWRGDEWQITERDPDELLAFALQELREGRLTLGPSQLELGLLGTFWLIAKGSLRRDSRGTENQRQDSEVIETMLRQPRGLYQLHRAIVDGREDGYERPVRAVNPHGQLEVFPSGEYRPATNVWLRNIFSDVPQPDVNEDSPAVRRDRALRELIDAVKLLDGKVTAAKQYFLKNGLSPALARDLANTVQGVYTTLLLWGAQGEVHQGSLDLVSMTEEDQE